MASGILYSTDYIPTRQISHNPLDWNTQGKRVFFLVLHFVVMASALVILELWDDMVRPYLKEHFPKAFSNAVIDSIYLPVTNFIFALKE